MKKKELTIDSVYKKLTQKDIDFETLNTDERTNILEDLTEFFDENPEEVIIRNKHYDILTKRFYVKEIRYDSLDTFELENSILFDKFEDFYQYLNGNIYAKACYFGYNFSNDEIKKYKINLNKINNESLFKKNIDDFSFEKIIDNLKEQYKNNEKVYKSLMKHLNKIDNFNSYKELNKSFQKFIKKFANSEDNYNKIFKLKNIFFSFLIHKNNESLNKIILNYFCKIEGLLSFDDILCYFGKDGAEYVINNFDCVVSNSTRRRRIKTFKDKLALFLDCNIKLNKKYGYDKDFNLYYVHQYNYSKEGFIFCRYFFDKESYENYLKNNINVFRSSMDEYDNFNVNELEYDDYKVNKYFLNNHFYVEQEWFLNNKAILKNKMCFEYIFDFIHFLKGDLSNADLLMCDNLSNLKDLKYIDFKNAKIRSREALELGLKINDISNEFSNLNQNELTVKNELETRKEFELNRIENEDYINKVSYVSDIHFSFKYQRYDCKTEDDKEYVIRKISDTLIKESTFANLIAGDNDFSLDDLAIFASKLGCSNNDFFFVLGNHDFSLNYEEVVDNYKKLFCSNKKNNLHLVNNNIFYYANSQWFEITEEELEIISEESLKNKLKESRLTIFGGPGFPDEVYLNDGMFIMFSENQKKQNEKFLKLYEMVTETLKNTNLIVLTHVPLKYWKKDIHTKPGVIYINGHTHRNYYFDNCRKRIYADNQIGYKRKDVHFKNFSIDLSYNYFNNYKDGIYEITRKDYESYYRGLNLLITVNREFENIYMLKRNEVYMFLAKMEGKLYILNGGAIKKVKNQDLNYYYDCMFNYSNSIKMFVSNYEKIQENISKEIRRIGGSGAIHGCIIDIDFFNHLYLDPFSGKLTPYFALNIKEKYVYENLISLLSDQCPIIYNNYVRLIKEEKEKNNLIILNEELAISNRKTFVEDTSIYKISRIIMGFQYITQNNIIRIWNDNIAKTPSVENGKLLIDSIVNPDKYTSNTIKDNNDPNREYALKYGGYDKIDWVEVYKDKIAKQTSTINVLEYVNSNTKATYKCKLCGHKWSVKPDYFKERQHFKCPNCKR